MAASADSGWGDFFIHGCFWHRHGVCRGLSIPANNPDFWAAKFADNVRRDREKMTALDAAGWRVLVVWECETRNRDALERTLLGFMNEVKNGDDSP